MADNDRRLSNKWIDLQETDQVPTRGKGTTAEQTERDQNRKRKRMPTEDKRAGRKITPTLSAKLVNKLRTICKAEGYVGRNGSGAIASPVIEDLLWFAVEAYGRGELESEEEKVIEVRARLRPRTGK